MAEHTRHWHEYADALAYVCNTKVSRMTGPRPFDLSRPPGPVALVREKDPANPIPPGLEKERFLEHILYLMESATPRPLAAQRRYKADYGPAPAPAGPTWGGRSGLPPPQWRGGCRGFGRAAPSQATEQSVGPVPCRPLRLAHRRDRQGWAARGGFTGPNRLGATGTGAANELPEGGSP